jgi:enoyl-CoA hydratase/carnithine racemase
MCCDVRFISTTAKISTAFTRRGLPAEFGASWLLPRIVGAHAMDLLLSGRVIGAAEALSIGLVSRVCEPESLLEEAVAYAENLATFCSPAAMAAVKEQVAADWDRSLVDSLVDAERQAARLRATPDFAEGVTSFVERRPPAFPPL